MRQSLSKLREARGKRREDLASVANVSVGTIINFEMGRSIPRFDQAQKIARLLDVAADDIAWGEPPDDTAGKGASTAVA